MIEFSSYLELNEVPLVDSYFSKDSKNIFFVSDALISGEGRSEYLGIKGTSIVMQIGGGQFQKKITVPTPGTKILVMPEFSYMPDQILANKNEKKYKDVLKNFLYDQTSLVID